MFLGAVLVRAQQQQPVLPGYGSEHSTCQDACPGGEMDIATPCFKGDKDSGMWKWMYLVVWPHCQKPVLDGFSAIAKAWLSQAFAKRCGFFPYPSVCLACQIGLTSHTLRQLYVQWQVSSTPQRLLHTWSGVQQNPYPQCGTEFQQLLIGSFQTGDTLDQYFVFSSYIFLQKKRYFFFLV